MYTVAAQHRDSLDNNDDTFYNYPPMGKSSGGILVYTLQQLVSSLEGIMRTGLS